MLKPKPWKSELEVLARFCWKLKEIMKKKEKKKTINEVILNHIAVKIFWHSFSEKKNTKNLEENFAKEEKRKVFASTSKLDILENERTSWHLKPKISFSCEKMTSFMKPKIAKIHQNDSFVNLFAPRVKTLLSEL